jgi:hypothetical protein
MERDRQRCDGSATSRIRGLPNSSLARGQKLAPVCQSLRSYVTRRKHKSDARAASLEPVAGVDRACTLRISRMSPDVAVMRDQKSPLSGTGVPSIRARAWRRCGPQTDEHGDRLRTSPSTPVGLTTSAASRSARRATGPPVSDIVNAPTPCAWSSPRRPGGMVASCSRLPLSWRRNRAGTDGALAMPSRFSHRTHWSLSPAKRRVGR